MSKIKQMLLGWCEHQVKVRRIGKGWNVRVFTNGILNQELRVYNSQDIGVAAREMLRWEDKVGNWSKHAIEVRKRMWNIDKYRVSYQGRYEVILVEDFRENIEKTG